MGFWIFILVMNLIIPVIMTGFGWYFLKGRPKEINHIVGYRTKLSMRNQDTWRFTHQYCGKLWFVLGLILLILTPLIMVLGLKLDNNIDYGGIICTVQVILLVGTIIPTERALHRTFNKDGSRKN